MRVSRNLASVTLAILVALSVAGCGRKNPPVLPDEQEDGYPHQYPSSTEPQEGIFD